MTQQKGSGPSTWLRLLALLLSASALPACKMNSTRPVAVPTPPPTVTCDQTPPPAQIPALPPRTTAPALMLPAMDAWALAAMAIYQREVTIRGGEHACLRDLRVKGVIR